MSVALTRNLLTTESKALLRKTVHSLRESLIAQLKESAEQRYLLSVPLAKAASSLDAVALERRRRLEAALEQAAQEDGGGKEARARAFEAAAKEAGATLLNRLVLIRHLEALELSKPAVLTGGWMSKGYQEFQQVAAALCGDETQGMAPLLDLLFADLALSLPGLFGDVGLTSLLAVPPATLRHVIEALDQLPREAWCDDLTLGWVYQYWNDPDREALDEKLNARGKLESHELASKTQMFTERYMVEWLLQNSLGPTWLAVCKKNRWKGDAESTGVLAQLDARRAEWRKRREAGEVAADALMPIAGPLEEAWKYYVPQPVPAAVVEHAPKSIRDVKLLDPACGSGHFLVVAFDLLVELYREEARHRGESWGDKQIAEWILENNLHGIDIDPRAVQIAAAAVYLKARVLAKDADPRQVNLVAPALKLSALGESDSGLLKLEADIQKETGIPPALTRQLINVLDGVDHLGSLLKLGDAIERALEAHEGAFARNSGQADMFQVARTPDEKRLSRDVAKKIVRHRLEGFLAKHTGAEDLGLRLRGQQLTAGLRFASIAKEGEYHLVVGNPPYQGTSKMKNAGYVAKNYPMGKSDLYAAFLERGLQLCRHGGAVAMVTMRNWMFLSVFADLRESILRTNDFRALGDLGTGAFSSRSMDDVISTSLVVLRRLLPGADSIAIQAAPLSDPMRDAGKPARRAAALLAHEGRSAFQTKDLAAVKGSPVVYWWSKESLAEYMRIPKVGDLAPVRFGVNTGNNARFLRRPWELAREGICIQRVTVPASEELYAADWVPFIGGAKGLAWLEPLREVLRYSARALELRVFADVSPGAAFRSPAFHFAPGVAFAMIGNSFSARDHVYRSVIGDKGSSVFPSEELLADFVCAMNSGKARQILQSLNPTVSFQVGDVQRLPLFPVHAARAVMDRVQREFDLHESGREASVEFLQPTASDWTGVQKWAQDVVDRGLVEVPEFTPSPTSFVLENELSFSVGLSLGRFQAKNGARASAASALPNGIFYLSPRENGDSVDLPPCARLRDAWSRHSEGTIRSWLRTEFWALHRSEYENRPIYLPLSSAKRSFVAYVSIHRWTTSTLTHLLSDHLVPERKSLEGALADLRAARAGTDKKVRSETDRQFADQTKWLEELEDFIAKVAQCAEKGAPPPDVSTPAREVDCPYAMDLDDGVMVNAAALWPLLEPMWKDPKKWWKELATAKGRKDYDWSHLAGRYFPDRVDKKCKEDPSLAVAHGCFWKYHPEVAIQWELRLQDEIAPDFLITEKDSDALRKAFLSKHGKRAAELQAAQQVRRERKANKKDQDELELDEADAPDEVAEAE